MKLRRVFDDYKLAFQLLQIMDGWTVDLLSERRKYFQQRIALILNAARTDERVALGKESDRRSDRNLGWTLIIGFGIACLWGLAMKFRNWNILDWIFDWISK